MDYFPARYGVSIPETGAWVMIWRVPPTPVTVPPLSLWFAHHADCNLQCQGVPLTKYRVMTPDGELCLWPHEVRPVRDIKAYLGRESEGVFLRPLDGKPAFNGDRLHYIMSRGIPRQQAQLMLIGEMEGEAFCWFEIAPQYGDCLGPRSNEWPNPSRCRFATPRKHWIALPPEVVRQPRGKPATGK